MAIVHMQKVGIVAHRAKQEILLDLLQREGVLEVSKVKEVGMVDHTEVTFKIAELEYAIKMLTECASKSVLSTMDKAMTEEAVERAVIATDVRGIIDEVHSIEAALQDARGYMDVTTGKSAAPASATNEQAAYFASSKVRNEYEKVGAGVAHMDAAQEAELRKEQQEIAEKNAAALKGKLAKLSEELPNLVLARRYLQWLDDKQAVRETMISSRSTIMVFGWIPTEKFIALQRTLEKVVPESALIKVDPDAREEQPVLLHNHPIIRPFESVTTLYGLPLPSEIDPTPLIFLFFILFFGLCLTDAGYGISLAIIMALFIWYKKITYETGKLWYLLMFGGIFTFLISIPFGGWWGLDPNAAWPVLTKPNTIPGESGRLFIGQVWNLGGTRGITFFQNLSLFLGLVHLSLGIFMSGVMKWRGGNKLSAFFNDWTTLILLTVIVSYFFVPADVKSNWLYAIFAAIALVIFGKGYGSKWYLVPAYGLLGFLNLTMSMVSNTLSYLRLLALGLVTGALALAVNLVAEQISALFPVYIAIPLAIILYILGHILNLALNTLGAFIHSGRLQFVEFFGNFFEGGGRPFAPFKRILS